MLPFVLGAVALGATGYGVKKYIEYNDDAYDKVSDFCVDTLDKMDKTGRSIENFFDDVSLKIDNYFGKDAKTIKDSIYEYNDLYSKFYHHVVPYFLDTFGNTQNLPDFNMDSFDMLQSKKSITTLSTIDQQSKDELANYNKKFSKGVYALLMESKEIRVLIQSNIDYNQYTKSSKTRIEELYKLMDELINIYYLPILDDDNQLSVEFKTKLDHIEAIADEKI